MHLTKVHGLGNDFLLINAIGQPEKEYNAIAPALCHRQTGIGADGLLIVETSAIADVKMRIINSDGSEAEMCGNGIRAFSKYVYERGIVKEKVFSIETLAGIMRPSLTVQDGVVTGITVDMGKPGITCGDVPVISGAPESPCIQKTITVGDQSFTYSSVRVGVPHTAVFVEDPVTFDLRTYGPLIEHAKEFPQRTNVNFVKVVDQNTVIQRTWERGCGPTLACGTGACSTAVCCIMAGLTGRKVEIKLELGSLFIEWPDEDSHVFMTGPAEIVFETDVNL